jgi:hypothetical protein
VVWKTRNEAGLLYIQRPQMKTELFH